MRPVLLKGIFFPLRHVLFTYVEKFLGISRVVGDCCDVSHGTNSKDSFEREVRLIGKSTGKVIC